MRQARALCDVPCSERSGRSPSVANSKGARRRWHRLKPGSSSWTRTLSSLSPGRIISFTAPLCGGWNVTRFHDGNVPSHRTRVRPAIAESRNLRRSPDAWGGVRRYPASPMTNITSTSMFCRPSRKWKTQFGVCAAISKSLMHISSLSPRPMMQRSSRWIGVSWPTSARAIVETLVPSISNRANGHFPCSSVRRRTRKCLLRNAN